MRDLLRASAWSLVWGIALGVLFDAVDAPWWFRAPWLVALGFTVAHMTRRQTVRWWWLRVRHHRAYVAPLVVDEDGTLHAPLLLPGESLHVCGQGARAVHAAVLRRNGSIRAEWPTRH